MRYHILIFLFLGPISFCCAQPNVLFGERSISRDIAAVFYDKDGNIYPDYFIADSSLTRSSASLADWYKDHPADFEKICGAYHCPFDKFAYDKLPVLNDSIAAMVRRSIEAKRNGLNSITFLVHGYRKPFNSLNGDSPSPRDFRMLETAMNNYNNGRMLYVEVYWDGMYDCCFSKNTRRNKELFRMFETARGNAGKVGGGLRGLISVLPFDTLNVVTHSLGAEVACSALFDTGRCRCATPANKVVNVCLIAPAISGIERFESYYVRNCGIDCKANDNYRLCIVYNNNDFVLKKKIGIFGPGPYKYGNTTLGCNYRSAVTELKDHFAEHYPHSAIYLLDLTGKVACHHVSCYSAGDNLKTMVAFMMK